MSNTNDYIITTLSSSIRQRTYETGVTTDPGAPFSLGTNSLATLRKRCSPYSVTLADPLSLFDCSASVGPSPTPPATQSLNLSFISASYMGGFSASLTPPPSYISPWLYMDFETSSSTVVSGNQGTYSHLTGTLRADGGSGIPPRYNADSFSGSYSLEFYDNSDVNTQYGWLTMGTPDENPEWGMLTGSWSLSFWYKPYTIGQYKSLFGFKDLDVSSGGYQFMLVLGDNTGSYGDGGPLGWYVSGTNNDWNFFESQTGDGALQPNEWKMITYVISGSNTDRPRLCEAYVNGISLGTPKNAGNSPTQFSYRYDSTRDIFFGPWYWTANTATWGMNGKIDEVSFWDFSLNSGQVSALYNGGSGANAMTALTQSS